MAAQLLALCFDANDPLGLARFWAGVLDWEMGDPADDIVLLDLAPPAREDPQAEVDRLVSLGASRIDLGQGEVSWVVMADPDGNEFCVLSPG